MRFTTSLTRNCFIGNSVKPVTREPRNIVLITFFVRADAF
jgi:hypothetical protein